MASLTKQQLAAENAALRNRISNLEWELAHAKDQLVKAELRAAASNAPAPTTSRGALLAAAREEAMRTGRVVIV